jgi:hypothetical protein
MNERDVNERPVFIDVLGRKRIGASAAERMWRRVDKSGGPEACWPFTGYTNPKGYGEVGGYNHGLAHRIAYESVNGAIPGGLFVCHHCDNPPCCNPAHHFVGTVLDNALDMVAKGRASDMRNERCGKTRLSDRQVADIRGRWAEGETLKDLAQEYGVTQAHLGRTIRGERRPNEGGKPLPDRTPEVWDKVRVAARRKAPDGAAVEAHARERERATGQRAAREKLYDEAQRLYEAGMTLIATGDRVGLSHRTLFEVLRRRGVEIRRPNAYLPPIDADEVRRMHAEGIRAGEMLRRLGVGRRRLYQVFDELGLPRFGAGAPPSLVRGEPDDGSYSWAPPEGAAA